MIITLSSLVCKVISIYFDTQSLKVFFKFIFYFCSLLPKIYSWNQNSFII